MLIAPRMAAAALLTIDVQADTLDDGALPVAGTSVAVPQIAALCQAFREAGRPIVHIVRLYRADGANAEPMRRDLVRNTPIFRPGTPGRLLAPGLTPQPATELDDELLLSGRPQMLGAKEIVLYKPRWGAFFGTELDEHLRAHAVNTVVVTGANFPNCPRTTIYEASERDYRILLAEDAISGLYDQARTELHGIAVTLSSSAQVIEEAAQRRRRRGGQ